MLATLAVQLQRERRIFLVGGIAYVVANIALAGLAGFGGERIGWVFAGIAFLGNVFYALTAEWETRWEAIWRREVPRIERALGEPDLVSAVLADPAPRRYQRWLKWISWALSTAWLVALLFTLAEAGLQFRIAG